MSVSVKVEGLADLETAMADLTKAASKAAMRRALRVAAQPVYDAMVANAPGKFGGLKASISISTGLAPRQKALNKRSYSKSGVEMFVGPSYEIGRGGRQAHLFEFGTVERFQKTTGRATGRIAMQPFVRPAWDSRQGEALRVLTKQMGVEIDKATARAQRKAARAAAKAAL